jgi:hypothetical protein
MSELSNPNSINHKLRSLVSKNKTRLATLPEIVLLAL